MPPPKTLARTRGQRASTGSSASRSRLGVTGPGSRDQIARDHAAHPLPDLHDPARRGVAEGHVLVEAVPDRARRADQALGAGPAQHLAGQVGPGAGLGDQRRGGEVADRPLGAGRHHRVGGRDQDLGGADRRPGQVGDPQAAVADGLDDLPHRRSTIAVWTWKSSGRRSRTSNQPPHTRSR